MVIKVQLKDPGMYPKDITVSTESELRDILRDHNRTYTLAYVEDGSGTGVRVYHREVGEREWWECCTLRK